MREGGLRFLRVRRRHEVRQQYDVRCRPVVRVRPPVRHKDVLLHVRQDVRDEHRAVSLYHPVEFGGQLKRWQTRPKGQPTFRDKKFIIDFTNNFTTFMIFLTKGFIMI